MSPSRTFRAPFAPRFCSRHTCRVSILIEAFYLAIPHLSWQTVVVGDPLCAPFSRKVLTRSDIEDPFDAPTGMPGMFSKRRMAAAQRFAKDVPAKVLALGFLAETRLATGDNAGAQRALEQATEAMPSLAGAQLQLGLLYEQAEEFTRAIERYRLVLKVEPNNAAALNNLAYGLAVRQSSPQEAKPLAEKAVALAPNDPNVADTLAWIEHLLGNHAVAAKLIRPVVKACQRIRRSVCTPHSSTPKPGSWQRPTPN